MKPEDIRAARLRKGWTQADLAQKVGCGQSAISMIEKGRRDSPQLMLVIEGLLRPEEPTGRYVMPGLSSRNPSKLPVTVKQWQRPEYSGDFIYLHPLPKDMLLIAAIDIAGHGASAMPGAVYLRGWLRGWLASQTVAPRLDAVVAALSDELRVAGLDAAGFFALISQNREAPHSVAYEAITCGFPAPLLLVGHPYRTLESAATGPSLPVSDQSLQTMRADLVAPWRLVVSTDGLLGRLGDRDERVGLRRIREWQQGTERDAPPEERLATDSPIIDDELFTVVVWTGWDIDTPLSTDDNAERHRLIGMIKSRLVGVDDARRERYVQALTEALNNACRHAYDGAPGPLRVAFREEPDRFRTEIEDEGKNGIDEDRDMAGSQSGFAVMDGLADGLDVRRGEAGGTVIGLELRKMNA